MFFLSKIGSSRIPNIIVFLTSILVFLLMGAKLSFLPENPSKLVYKTVDNASLYLRIYYPENLDSTKSYPTIVFFFGGGWYKGSYKQFESHANYFARRGMIAVLADYRIQSVHQSTPFDAVKDAKSAIRYLRNKANILHIDTGRIVAAGGSAGGHLAAVAGNITGLEEDKEDLAISSKPNALVLFNPVFDNGPGGFGYDQIGSRYMEISPIHNIRYGAPPTIIFLGTEDHLIPVATAKLYEQKMKGVGARCELFLYEGQKHGFFNTVNKHYYEETIRETDSFLISLGYLKSKSNALH